MPASMSTHTSVAKTLQVPGCGPKGRRQEEGGRRVELLDLSGRGSRAGTLANGGVASSGFPESQGSCSVLRILVTLFPQSGVSSPPMRSVSTSMGLTYLQNSSVLSSSWVGCCGAGQNPASVTCRVSVGLEAGDGQG